MQPSVALYSRLPGGCGSESGVALDRSETAGMIGWKGSEMIRTLKMTHCLPLATVAMFLTVTVAANAQWDPYPWKRVPRTPDGKVDLNAPAPRRPARDRTGRENASAGSRRPGSPRSRRRRGRAAGSGDDVHESRATNEAPELRPRLEVGPELRPLRDGLGTERVPAERVSDDRLRVRVVRAGHSLRRVDQEPHASTLRGAPGRPGAIGGSRSFCRGARPREHTAA